MEAERGAFGPCGLGPGSINLDVCRLYLEHRFNLLGSGWVQVRRGMRCRGVGRHRYEMGISVEPDRDGRWLAACINPSNLARSQQVWRPVDPDYVPIDWQLDFKSGYRWSGAAWYGDIPLTGPPGSDIKVPWELARMQHLPQMAVAHAALRCGTLEPRGEGTAVGNALGGVPPSLPAHEWSPAAAERHGGRSLQENCRNLNTRPAQVENRSGELPPERLAREFRNQVLDFIATNPPRFGVNWRCAMDVGIRVANWLVAWDLFQAAGTVWDADFNREFAASVDSHARFIANNLEGTKRLRGNHYLADIAGLLFASAYLPASRETDGWLAFAAKELVAEVATQFTPDGANFEASTSYHRLSAEMVAWSTALLLALGPQKRAALEEESFPEWYFDRLGRMAEFTVDVTKPTGRIHQVGDNDSGRFLNLQPAFRRMTVTEAKQRSANLAGYDELPDEAPWWDEDSLDHRSLVATIGGVLGRTDLEAFCGPDRIEPWLIRNILGSASQGRTSQISRPTECSRIRKNSAFVRVNAATECPNSCESGYGGTSELARRALAALPSGPQIREYSGRIALPDSAVLDGLACRACPDFGLYIWRSERLYLAVRCGPVGQNGIGGHAHNDQLAIELTIDGRDLIADPGTYLYTPDPQARNAYRSVTVHAAPQTLDGREPGRLDVGLFQLGGDPAARCLYFGPDGFVGRHDGFGEPVHRAIRLTPESIAITDYAGARLPLKNPPTMGPHCAAPGPVAFSPGYGAAMRWDNGGLSSADDD